MARSTYSCVTNSRKRRCVFKVILGRFQLTPNLTRNIPNSPLKIFNQSAKKGKAFTWRARDWAHKTALRTFSIRFVEELDALDWKQQAEQSKANNCNIRKGIDVPEFDDICSILNSASIVD